MHGAGSHRDNPRGCRRTAFDLMLPERRGDVQLARVRATSTGHGREHSDAVRPANRDAVYRSSSRAMSAPSLQRHRSRPVEEIQALYRQIAEGRDVKDAAFSRSSRSHVTICRGM